LELELRFRIQRLNFSSDLSRDRVPFSSSNSPPLFTSRALCKKRANSLSEGECDRFPLQTRDFTVVRSLEDSLFPLFNCHLPLHNAKTRLKRIAACTEA